MKADLFVHQWRIEGDINNAKLLTSFLKWVIVSPHTLDNYEGDRKHRRFSGKVTQLVTQIVKTDMQKNCKQQNRSYNKIGGGGEG